MSYISCHNHTDKSNFRLSDCTNKVEDLLLQAIKLGLKGLAITDHETVSAHIEAIIKTKELKEKGKMPEDFKLILGNEIYLVNSLEEVRDNYRSGITKFPHFILLAKDKEGHKQIRELSSLAWENLYSTGQMERVPTVKSEVERVISGGHVIGTTACLGGEFALLVGRLLNAEPSEVNSAKREIHEFITWCIKVFGKDNFFIEIQPSIMTDQIVFNKKAVEIAKAYGLKWIITTDSHYLSLEYKSIHEAYLNSQDGEREIADFYSSTYLMETPEIWGYMMDYLHADDVQAGLDNTLIIGEMVESYDLYHPVIVPVVDLPDFKLRHIFSKAYGQFDYIKKFAHSVNAQDRYLLKLIEDGFDKKERPKKLSKEKFYQILDRINTELGELWEITKKIENEISAYYVLTKVIVDIMWNEGDSLVGVARGSVTGFYTAYLIDITQLNPMDWNLPHWRHLVKDRPELPDIDLDSQANKRKQILEALVRKFGGIRVLNICTFGTEGSKSAMLTGCRGLGIDNDTAQYIADMIPFERGANWSLKECFEGDEEKNRKPIKEFINEVNQYPNLKEVALGIEGLVNKRSIHASGVFIFKDSYLEQNAIMKAPNGQNITQWNMTDSEYCGGLKVDLLTIEGLDKIRTTMDILIDDGYMDWQGNLRDTYNKYLHPDVLDYTTPEMWKMIGDNAITDLFQFDTEVGLISAQKVKPSNLFEMAVTNSLMRLVAENGEEQPVDTYVKYKNDISLWYKEMRSFGLTEDEIKVLEELLLPVYGVADTQEVVMLLSMHPKISNFDIKQANKLRKGIAKKKGKVIDEARQLFYEQGQNVGTSLNMLNYVWNVQIKRQLGYSFSINHTTPYSCIGLQEMNLAFHYPKIYWETACLSVNAGASDEDNEDSKGTDYGKIAQAIGNMQQRGVVISLPDINDADFGFKADLKNNRIIFGLKGINGIGDEVVKLITSNRPYQSFDDFYKRMVETKLIKQGQCLQIIKAGCFDSIEERVALLKKYAYMICEPKTKITLQNFSALINNGIIPEDMQIYVRYYRFRNYISQYVYKTIEKPKDRFFLVNTIASQFFRDNFTEKCIVDYFGENIVISEKQFTKEYDALMKPFKDWMVQPQVLETLNKRLFENVWNDIGQGGISKWEMDSLCYYYHDHELKHVDRAKYGVVNFFDLSPQPEVVGVYYSRGKERQKFNITRIVGTVLHKNKYKHTVSLLTPDGVVTVKFYDGAFTHYDKQISQQKENGEGKEVLEKSWFSRGNKLIIAGYRREGQFRPYKYSDSVYQHTVGLIEDIDEQGNLKVVTERTRVD